MSRTPPAPPGAFPFEAFSPGSHRHVSTSAYSPSSRWVGVPAIRRLGACPEGVGRPKIVITHAVVDVERWLKGKAERAAVISEFATQVTDNVAMDGSNNIAITADVHDLAGAQAMMASPSPETAAAMERHGVPPRYGLHREVAGRQLHRQAAPMEPSARLGDWRPSVQLPRGWRSEAIRSSMSETDEHAATC